MAISEPGIFSAAVLILCGLAGCYYDLKYRELPEGFWISPYLILGSYTAVMYAIGNYPIEVFYVSVVVGVIYFVALLLDAYKGADFAYIAAITFFFVQAPLTGNFLMPVSFSILLLAVTICYAIANRTHLFDRWFVSDHLEGFPLFLPITTALIFTVILA